MAAKQKKRRKKPIKVVFAGQTEEKLILPFVLLLANKFLSMIGFLEFIDRSVEWDAKHWKVSPGNLAKAVVLVTFLQIRTPLYRIKNSFVGIDTEALFGEGVMPEHLNDDAIARALDRISQAKPNNLFSSLCLSLYSKFDIVFKRLHSDTTTLSFYGEYEPSEKDIEDVLKVVRGYNKDRRPECKKVVVGKIVNEHGIAVAGYTMDGNTSDSEWNQKALELVKDTFGEKLNEVTYIADSKLINMPLFKQLMDPKKGYRLYPGVLQISAIKLPVNASKRPTKTTSGKTSGTEILRQYKEQSIVEVQFKMLKEPALASAIFLKTPERINALVMLLNISLLIRALIQYKIRKSVKESKEELPRIWWDNRKLENPTIKYVIEMLQKSHLVKTGEASYRYGFFNDQQMLQVTTILKLLGIRVEELLE